MSYWLKQRCSNNPCIKRLQQQRNQVLAEVTELQDDLKLLQGILRHKQQQLRQLNQSIATKTRHASQWRVLDCNPDTLPSPTTTFTSQPAALTLVAKCNSTS